MTVYGYARVSTQHQDLKMQEEALRSRGIPDDLIFSDKKTGKNMEREALKELLSKVEEGDTIIVKKLDRLGRSVSQVTTLVDELSNKGVYIKSLDDGVDTSNNSPMAKAMMQLLAMFSEMERNFIEERTRPAIESAKARGVEFGRKKINKSAYDIAVDQYLNQDMNANEIIKYHGKDRTGKDVISRATLFRRIKEHQAYENAIKRYQELNGGISIEQLIAEGDHKIVKEVPVPILKKGKLTKMLKELEGGQN
jgi:DNA invertase Pin-like site-specific DNA recombinase